MPATHPYSGVAANTDVKTRTEEYRSFAELLRFLEEEHVFSRLIASNVQVVASDWDNAGDSSVIEIDVVLYDTPIVRYYKDGSFSVDNGGFNTPTTMNRINQFTPSWFWCCHMRKKLVTRAEHVATPYDFRNYGQGWKICTHDVRFPVNPAEGMVD